MSKSQHIKLENFLRDKLKIHLKNDPYQEEYVRAISADVKEVQAVFSDSAAGTGKTSLAISTAYFMLINEMIDQIIYLRSAVSIREMGFLPGDVAEKEAPYMQSGLDALSKLDNKNPNLCDTLINNEQLVIATTAYLRGVDWDGNKLLIIDEAQNLTLHELQTVLTRPHDTTKIVVIGSSVQCDLPYPKLYEDQDSNKKLSAFEFYAKWFVEYTPLKVKIVDLFNNYRGRFSQYADMINRAYSIEDLKIKNKNDVDLNFSPPEDELAKKYENMYSERKRRP